MAGISALGTNYNLPNYTGILHSLTPQDTPFFSAIGGLSGGGQTTATAFEWQTYDGRTATQPEALEGADAPTLTGRVRANVSNVVQIHHSAVGVAYSKAAAVGLKSGVNNDLQNPVRSELDWQVEQELKAMVRDVEYSFINGAYQLPSDNATGRKTRGLLAAITSNTATMETIVGNGASVWEADDEVITEATHGLAIGDRVRIAITSGATGASAGYFYVKTVPTADTFTVSTTYGGSTQAISADGVVDVYEQQTVTVTAINNMMRSIWDNGGMTESETSVLLCNSAAKLQITAAYAESYGKFQETSRNIAGVNVTQIQTDLGPLSIMLDRHMPQHTIAFVSLEQCRPVFLEVPGKGHFFAEPLAKTGATDRTQLYGEVGLEYGSQAAHGKITGITYR